MEPLEYETPPAPANAYLGMLVAGWVCSGITLAIVLCVFWEAMLVQYAGLYRPGVSFFGRLSLKAYHVQMPGLAWLFPACGLCGGVVSRHGRWPRAARTCAVTAMVCVVAMITMEFVFW